MKSVKVSDSVYEKLIELRAREEIRRKRRVTFSEILEKIVLKYPK